MVFTPIPMNAARICDGLSRIGYTPQSAICDIIDNAVTAKAKHVYIRIEPEQEAPDTRRNNVKEYLIIDDGMGMNENEILDALALGSPSDNYEPHSLSKFGLGLKSAAFSQGEVLEVISSTGGEKDFIKQVVSLPVIRSKGEYGADSAAITTVDLQLINEYLPDGHGTIIRIAEVRKNDHPSIRSTLQELRTKVGAIYYYIIQQDDFHIKINNEECEPFDVLFTKEADENGNLDENTWDGRTTRWIEKPHSFTVDAERNVQVNVEVTQLPHPPTFKLEGGPNLQRTTRDKYKIEANNYGYYVYRNRRLLAWCEKLEGIIPQDQDYFAFRGRIVMDDSADETFNIDVKKSHLQLSDEAHRVIEDISYQYKRKSKRAWQHANEIIKQLSSETGLVRSNTLAQNIEMPEELPGILETEAQYEEAERREQEIQKRQRERIKELIDRPESEATELKVETGPSPTFEPTEEEIEEAAIGPEANQTDRIFLVNNTIDNVLWEPYYDTDRGTCVRVNRLHRFTRIIYENNSNNGPLQTMIGLLLLELAGAEHFVLRNYTNYDQSNIEAIIQEFRRVSTDFLAKLCRDLADSLPSE